jgi:hypothetical protein
MLRVGPQQGVRLAGIITSPHEHIRDAIEWLARRDRRTPGQPGRRPAGDGTGFRPGQCQSIAARRGQPCPFRAPVWSVARGTDPVDGVGTHATSSHSEALWARPGAQRHVVARRGPEVHTPGRPVSRPVFFAGATGATLRDREQRWTLALVCTAAFMLLLDITVVSVALPSIQRELRASLSDLQWVSAA